MSPMMSPRTNTPSVTRPAVFLVLALSFAAGAFGAGGGSCSSSCAVEPPAPLAQLEIEAHLAAVADAPLAEPSLALETLLFHADATRAYLDRYGALPLDPQRTAFLRRELARTHARIEMRVVDADGVVRARLEERRVRLGEKTHLWFDRYESLQPFEASGTVVRVGLGHIWARY